MAGKTKCSDRRAHRCSSIALKSAGSSRHVVAAGSRLAVIKSPAAGAGGGPAPLLRAAATSNVTLTAAASTTSPFTAAQQQQCKLVAGPAALGAQLLLLVVVVFSLFIKRHRERPKRPWVIWLLDLLKQACSAGAGHAVGMGVAILAHMASHGASECGWYFVVYFADCTLGLTLAISFHKLVNGAATHFSRKQQAAQQHAGDKGKHDVPWWEALVEIGNYGDPPNYRRWGVQVVFWMLCVVTARLIVGVVVISSIPQLQLFTASMDQRFQGRPDTYVFTVVVGIPIFVNIGQAWVQDQVLKWRHRGGGKGGAGKGVKGMEHSMDAALALGQQQAEGGGGTGGRRNE